MKRIYFFAMPGFLIAVFLSGCASNYYILTNAYLDKTSIVEIPASASFAVLQNQAAPNPIFDNEVKAKIEDLLQSKGYHLSSPDKADYFISYNYDISGKAKTDTWPEYVNGPSIVHRVYVSGSNTVYNVVSPGYSYVTYVSRTHTAYTARLFVKVLDANAMRKDNKEKVFWVGDTMNESSNPDLRESIDYLLVGTFKYFGRDTGKNQQITLSADDKEVLAMRNAVGPSLNTTRS